MRKENERSCIADIHIWSKSNGELAIEYRGHINEFGLLTILKQVVVDIETGHMVAMKS